ncbi:spore germination protein D [Paenibacillus sp. UNCCL117]|uniref:spore germination lipoprotein GerD n=1 Tax=unclassified Paenibacillus TaxID=185978 RepID=UPI0008886DC2|nr:MULTISPECIES: spore germination lipoprotein GerD [unclassified Paenibacillus]SDE57456.1 spore germination protein D [Paenibacillus sp. cl123]SFW68398.1 spore germination protein D [Paenibacillus sp. UNCCL117]
MRTQKRRLLIPALLIAGLLSACGSDTQASSSGNGSNYKDIKSMVLDILKTEDGRVAIQEATIHENSKLQLLSAGDTQQLQLAVKDVLVDTDQTKFLQKMITDPKFAGQFAKAIEKDTKKIQKDLMKDPEYQKQMMEAMKSPDFETMLLDTMKTTPYRTQMKTVIQESLQSPLFRLELMELMKKVLQEESMPKQQGQGGQKQGQGQGQGGGEGGGQEEESGGEQNGQEKNSDSG